MYVIKGEFLCYRQITAFSTVHVHFHTPAKATSVSTSRRIPCALLARRMADEYLTANKRKKKKKGVNMLVVTLSSFSFSFGFPRLVLLVCLVSD